MVEVFNRQQQCCRVQRGFSLVELMITITVAAILLGLALPSFRELTIRSNVTELNNGLVHALSVARSEAVRRGTQVEVKSTSDTGTWNGGWEIRADSTFDSSFTTIISTAGASPNGYTVCATAGGPTGIGGDGHIVFDQTGALSARYQTSFDINVNRPDGNQSLGQHIVVQGSGELHSNRNTGPSPAPATCT